MFVTKERVHKCSVKSAYSMLDIQEAVLIQLLGICTKQDGFYCDVQNIVILSTKASITGLILCDVKCSVKLFSPQTGQTISATVEKCIDNMGIYCVCEGMNILVPFRSLQLAYSFHAPSAFVSEAREINEGTRISVLIEKIRYQNGKYKALGTLID